MNSGSNSEHGTRISVVRGIPHAKLFRCAVISTLGLALLAGCQTAPAVALPSPTAEATEAQTLREGDVVKIAFPGAANLDTAQPIRRDGRITLSIVGEVMAAGLTPAALEKDLIQRYSSQLVSKEVTVTVVSSSFSIYVIGAVMHAGKVTTDHQLSALEGVMEAGGFDNTKANPKRVVVIRIEEGKTKRYELNLQAILDGKTNQPFILKPADIVFVPEKITWF
jgi:polysaccharide export outer membrane protein